MGTGGVVHYPYGKLPPVTRALIISGLAILTWLPLIALGYEIIAYS
jgi:hypothetical protein